MLIHIILVASGNSIIKNDSTKVKFLLVSRSKHMHEILEKEFGDKLSKNSVLRHPRVFNILKGFKNTYHDNALQKLKYMHKRIEAFLENLPPSDELSSNNENQEFQQIELSEEIDKIKKDWNFATALEASLKVDSIPDHPLVTDKYGELRSSILPLLKQLQQENGFRKYLLDRLEELTLDWENNQTTLGIYLEQLDPKKEQQFRNY